MSRAAVKYRKVAWPKPRGFRQGTGRFEFGDHALGNVAREHLEWLAVRGYSASTVYQRRIGLLRFFRWCEERALTDAREITKPILERYQKHLFYYRKGNGRPLAPQAQARLLLSLKAFFKWLSKENRILSNPASELELPKTPKRLPKVILSVQEIEAVLREADPAHVRGLRDRAMLETLYSTGVRRAELCNLALYDIDLDRHALRVRGGKGNKDRLIPIGQRACAWVEKYLTDSRPQLLVADHDMLFVTDYGEPLTHAFLTNRIKRLLRLAHIEKAGGAHLFRHAMATHMLDNGADTRFIQAMLGHANLQTTQIYTQVSIEKLRQIHEATHPARLERQAKRTSDAIDERSERDALLSALAAESDEDEDADSDSDESADRDALA
jgi:integrase/recombinase XerD